MSLHCCAGCILRSGTLSATTTRLRLESDNVPRTGESTHLQFGGEPRDHVETTGVGGAAECVRKGGLHGVSDRQQSRNLAPHLVVLRRLFRVVFATIDD